MKRTLAVLISLILISSAARAGEYEIISQENGSVTVRFTPEKPVITPLDAGRSPVLSMIRIPGYPGERIDGRPVLPVQRFLFEVPADRGIRLQVIDKEITSIDGILPEVWFGGKADYEKALEILSDPNAGSVPGHAFIAAKGIYRKRHIVLVDLYPVLFDSERPGLIYAGSITVRLSFDPPDLSGRTDPDAGIARLPGDRLIVNASQASVWREAGTDLAPSDRTPYEFALSDNWVKLTLSSSGLYSVGYADLLSAGIDPVMIDPATIRIFSGGPFQQPDEIADGGSFEEDYHMTEYPVYYDGTGSGEFFPGESIIFYGVGLNGWMNQIDPAAESTEYYEHYYAKENVYWMTWDGSFGASEPKQLQERDVSPGGEAPDTTIVSYQERIHVEKDYAYDPKYTDDRWYWRYMAEGSGTFVNEFELTEVTDGTGLLRTRGYSPYHDFKLEIADYFINGSLVGTLQWRAIMDDFVPATLSVDLDNLIESANQFKVTIGSEDKMYMMSYDIFYKRNLSAAGGVADYFSPPFSGKAGFSLDGFTSDEIYLLDITDFRSPVLLTGSEISGGVLEFEDNIGGSPAHYTAVEAGAIQSPGIETAFSGGMGPVSLRDESFCPHMLIICNGRFEDAANILKNYREANIHGITGPVVQVVDINTVYDNFSNGMKDPVAIRNYLKFLYDNFSDGAGPVIRYLLLLGNGTYDPRDLLGTGNDFVPLYVTINDEKVIEDDDFYGRLDDENDWFIDIAIGRMTVFSSGQAERWVSDIIGYETGNDFGKWRNEVVLVADDEFSNTVDCDFRFINSTEDMTVDYTYFPDFIDFNKIYLHEYPFDGTGKPQAKQALLDAWNDGALIVNYVGHGSPNVMADERAMEKSDIASLVNGNRRPLYLSFSCSVANIESPYQTSLGQDLVLSENGGAIAVIGATGQTYFDFNELVNHRFMKALFTSEDSTGTETIGSALALAKPWSVNALELANTSQFLLLGDPATKIYLPAHQVECSRSEIDSMLTGKRYRFYGSVRSGGEVFESFNGKADIIVQESRREVNEPVYGCGDDITRVEYYIPGANIFRGSVDVTDGRFSADFVVPLRCRAGGKARVRSYVSSAETDGVGAEDYLVITSNPDPPVNESPPHIDIYFAGRADKVKQGSILTVDISDPDGISIRGVDPQSSIFLEFDQSGYFRVVTEFFKYEHGSSTTGRVEYPIPSGFDPGEHSVVVRAFDNLGASASDTLEFELVEDGLFTVSDVFNLPNPVSESTNFIFQLSSAADVVLRLYNVSGREIWNDKTYGNEGYNSIYWNGRDFAGDIPANGTYLYIIDVSFRNSYNRSETVTGKVVLIR
ncbi:MAG: type IX secretion system sortase PorU [Candidatus Krumholzibacteriota bacterium]|nr:type IX secretion system sortase PorU [Candidatus Krumholzibacteriota bacterium]